MTIYWTVYITSIFIIVLSIVYAWVAHTNELIKFLKEMNTHFVVIGSLVFIFTPFVNTLLAAQTIISIPKILKKRGERKL